MNIEEKFKEFYNRFLISNKDSFNKMENQRNKAIYERKNNKKIIIIVELILLIVFILWIIVFGLDENNDTIPELCFLAGFLFPMIIALKKKQKLEEYEDIYQNTIIRNIIQYFSPRLDYYPDESIGCEDYQKIGVENFNEFNSSNTIRGIYTNNEITISKIITKYIRSYNHYNGLFKEGPTIRKRTSVEETFNGIFVKAKLSKSANTELYIKSKEEINESIFNSFIENISNAEGKEYDKIDIQELNDIFNVYSSNLEGYSRILDSEIKTTLINIYNNQKFELVIKNNYIYIRFWIDGLFSNPPLERETNDKEILYKNYKVLYLVFYLLTKIEEKI